MSSTILEIAAQIRETGRRATSELPPLLRKAEELATDENQSLLTRALAYRAAGNALQLLSNFEAALQHYDKAVAILETADEPAELGRTLMVKVGFLFYLSRFDELFECADRARRLLEGVHDRQRLGRLDINLAHAYFRLDRHSESLQCSERALATLEPIGDKEGILGATINSAVTFSSMHEFERAEQGFCRALTLAEELNIPAAVRLSHHNLAYLSHLRGDSGEALRALAALRTEHDAANEERQLCLCWLDEAEILLDIGDLDEAIHAAKQARILAEKLGLNSEIGRSLLFEAASRIRLGHADESLQLLGQATKRFQSEGNDVLAAVSRLQAALFRSERGESDAFNEAVSARSQLVNSGLPHRRALAEIVVGRIQRYFGDTNTAIESFRSARQIAEASRCQWMLFHAYYELGLSLLRQNPRESTDLFRKAEAMLDSLWNKLGSDDLKMAFLGDRENVYTYLVPSTIADCPEAAFDLSEKARSRVLRERLINDSSIGAAGAIPGRLAPEETIVEYFISGNDLSIFTVSSDGIDCIHRVGVVQEIREQWTNLERHLSSCSVKWERLQSARRHLESTALHHFQLLYCLVIEPVRAKLRSRLIIVPHGFLHAIPFHALHDGERFLVDSYEVSYSPSASLYCSAPSDQKYEEPLFIAFGKDGLTSIAEIEEVSQNFANASVLVNPSVAEIRRAFNRPRQLIHISGHAGLDLVQGKFSWIDTHDGRLTSRDLTDMHMQAKTLVITGCQTARRVIQPGDEWLGLMRALYIAGASSIVAAFWDIRDEAARRFSTEFYRHFDGSNTTSAVRKACVEVRQWQAHPYFWSGFGSFERKKLGELYDGDHCNSRL